MSTKNIKNLDIIERIFKVQEFYSLTQIVFAEKTNISQSFLSEIKSKRSGPSVKLIIGIANAFPEINLRWLLTGEGEMFINKISNRVAEPRAIYGQSTAELEEIVKKIVRMPKAKRQGLITILRGLIELINAS